MKPEMSEAALLDLLQQFERSGIEVWLDGGWAVDAVVGERTRAHRDLDLILRASDLDRLCAVIGPRGFTRQVGGTESNFVLANGQGLEVDIHTVVFDAQGNGVHRMENGGDWVFRSSAFEGRGMIGSIPVRCLSPETQVECHAQGYTPSEKDFRDMQLLAARCGVELPPSLRRPQRT
ncbi:MAG TPA: hypothetical protein VIS96_16625 [Terrimicrobiaceae bacterium]